MSTNRRAYHGPDLAALQGLNTRECHKECKFDCLFFGESKICKFDIAIFGDEDVLWLQVPIDDIFLVQILENEQNLSSVEA